MSDPDDIELYTVAEAAERLRVSTATVYRLIRNRQISHVKVAGSITMFRPEQISDFLDAHTVDRNA